VIVELLEQPLLEFLRVIDRQSGHQVKCALRAFADDAGDFAQLFDDGVAAAVILLAHGVEVGRLNGIKRGSRDLIERGDGEPALAVFERVAQKFPVVTEQAADARAAGGKALGHGIDENQVFIRFGQLGEGRERLAGIDKFTVDLVGDQKQIMLFRHIQDHFHLRTGQNGAGRVAGIRDKNRAGVFVDDGLDFFAVGVEIALLRLRRNGGDRRAGGGDEGVVVGIERFGDDDLVAVVEDALRGDLQRFAAACRDEHLARIERDPDVLVVAADGVDQHGLAGRLGIGKHGLVEIAHGLKKGFRRLNIRLADIQMIDLFPCCCRRDSVRVEFTHG